MRPQESKLLLKIKGRNKEENSKRTGLITSMRTGQSYLEDKNNPELGEARGVVLLRKSIQKFSCIKVTKLVVSMIMATFHPFETPIFW